MPDAGGEEVSVREKRPVNARKRGFWGKKGRWALGGESGLDDSQLDARGGSEDWGKHGKGEEINDDGRKSQKSMRKGGKSAERQELKKITKGLV